MTGEAYKRSTKNQQETGHGKATKKSISIPNGAELNSTWSRIKADPEHTQENYI